MHPSVTECIRLTRRRIEGLKSHGVMYGEGEATPLGVLGASVQVCSKYGETDKETHPSTLIVDLCCVEGDQPCCLE